MRDWSIDHPKAKLMARKRAAILGAARDAFLRDGYGGASMETIAAAAGVSIMTLYRHAETKDDLFAAVISSVCHPTDQAEQARIAESLQKPLRDILIFVGMMFQERLASIETTALFRAVMVETKRFPHLADMAYRGLIGTHQMALDSFLAGRTETKALDAKQRQMLGLQFFDRLVGIDSLRTLLGLEGISEAERLYRAETAAAGLLAGLPVAPPRG